MYKTVFLPILTYSSESSALPKKHKKRYPSYGNVIFKRGKKRRDKVRNVYVKEEFLKVQPAAEIVATSHSYIKFGHVMRMEGQKSSEEGYMKPE